MITVTDISPESREWEKLLKKSHQYSLYLEPEWMRLHPVKAYAAYRGEGPGATIVGGIVVTPTVLPTPFVPYQGLVQTQKEDPDVAESLIRECEELGRPLSVWSSPSLVDIRPFHERAYDREERVLWRDVIRYTYLCTPESRLEPRARANVTDREVEAVTTLDWYEEWKEQPWVTQHFIDLMDKMLGFSSTQVWGDGEATVVWGVDRRDRGYYLAAIGSPTNVLDKLIRRHHSVDLVGCNSPRRSLFKRSFGGILRTYYGCVTT